jgi:hypothetical protein
MRYRGWTADAAQQLSELAAQARKLNTEIVRLQQLSLPARMEMAREMDVALADIGRLAAQIELWMLQAAQGEGEDV